MRKAPLLVSALGLFLTAAASARAGDDLARYYRAYAPEELEPVAGDPPARVRILPPIGPDEWPEPVRAPLESRVRSEWPRARIYGPLQSSVGLWLTYPLVTGQERGRLLVPVVASTELTVRGVVDLPAPVGPRRVVLLVDASSSANAQTLFRTSEGSIQSVSVLEAERRALRHLLEEAPETDDVELGLVAYGESTWPLAKPGSSRDEIRARLDAWERQTPRGVGRTDLLCALEVARDWLRDTPSGVGREVVLLTDGDLPHSGRFNDCRRRRGPAKELCESRRNRSACPASHTFRTRDGYSDLVQLERFQRRARRDLSVYPLVFDPTRSSRSYRALARATGGQLFRVPSAQALEGALPALIHPEVRSVHARNERTRERTGDLLDRATGRFRGRLGLASGANDIVLRVEGRWGPAALYRFRIYSAPDHLQEMLAELRDTNSKLAERVRHGQEALETAQAPAGFRRLEVRAEAH